MKPFDTELTTGSITRSVWKLAWPMILLNLINGLHGIIDHLLVGNFVPSEANEANAAIGVAWQLFLVVIVFIASLFHGMNVLVARYTGKRDREALSHVVYHTFLTATYIFLFLVAPVGYVLTPYLLEWFNANEAVQVHALPYMRILFVGSAPLFLMFMLTGALQASGTPKIPLALGVLTTILNIVLSTLFIIVLGLGAVGAALGTCLAPCASVLIALALIRNGKAVIQLPKALTLIPDWNVIRTVSHIGIPTGFQAVILNLAGAFLIYFLGHLPHSAAAQAAYTICYTQLFSFVMWAAFGLRVAASTVIGQNIGAGEVHRGKRGVYIAAAMGTAWGLALGGMYWVFPEMLLGLFDAANGPIQVYGVSLLRCLAMSGVVLSMALAFTGGLQGAGDTKSPLYIAIITQFGILLGICAVALKLDCLTAETVWNAILVAHTARFALSFIVFAREKWIGIHVGLQAQ